MTPSARLYRSIYLHGLMLLGLVAGATAIVGAAFGRAAVWRDYPERLALHLARQVGRLGPHPDTLKQELTRMAGILNIELTLYSPDSAVLVATGERPLPPLQPDERAQVSAGPLHLRRPHFVMAVAVPDGGYLVMGMPGYPARFILRIVSILVAVFLVLALGSLPLARAIARPLEQLSTTARRLGDGDLTVRSGIVRKDEIGALAAAFDDMANRLQTLVQGERELLANVSHELRTPMSRIRVALELAADGDAEAARKYLSEISTDLAELERLVDDILAAARFDSLNGRGAPPLRLGPVRPESLVDEALERFRSTHPNRVLDVVLANALPTIEADPKLLRRALDNLLDNAAKYSDPGPPIALEASSLGEELVFVVRDQGIGIDPADLPRIFTPFFRTDRSRARKTGGVGLGLALARRIVEAHHGRIEVTSTPGSGTTVRLLVPGASLSPAEA